MAPPPRDRIAAISEHERLPEIAALEYADRLVHTPDGAPAIARILADVEAAKRRGGAPLPFGLSCAISYRPIRARPIERRRAGAELLEGFAMTLKTVRLELGRDPDFPEGSPRRGYEFVAPLNADGHLDAEEWRTARGRCAVRRFWEGEPDERGHLVHRRGGTWAFHYDVKGDPDEDEPGWKFNAHTFKVGEYVSLREPDGELRTFRVVAVRPAG